eukprot:2450679-Amphidinium_carterae.1
MPLYPPNSNMLHEEVCGVLYSRCYLGLVAAQPSTFRRPRAQRMSKCCALQALPHDAKAYMRYLRFVCIHKLFARVESRHTFLIIGLTPPVQKASPHVARWTRHEFWRLPAKG